MTKTNEILGRRNPCVFSTYGTNPFRYDPCRNCPGYGLMQDNMFCSNYLPMIKSQHNGIVEVRHGVKGYPTDQQLDNIKPCAACQQTLKDSHTKSRDGSYATAFGEVVKTKSADENQGKSSSQKSNSERSPDFLYADSLEDEKRLIRETYQPVIMRVPRRTKILPKNYQDWIRNYNDSGVIGE